ncbi:MAG: hypothetical protein ACFB9N_16830 [Geitlerinemataceae cyanobacterium]
MVASTERRQDVGRALVEGAIARRMKNYLAAPGKNERREIM